jgi:hypothetical protein
MAVTVAMVVHFYLVNKQVRAGRKIIANLPGFQYTL